MDLPAVMLDALDIWLHLRLVDRCYGVHVVHAHMLLQQEDHLPAARWADCAATTPSVKWQANGCDLLRQTARTGFSPSFALFLAYHCHLPAISPKLIGPDRNASLLEIALDVGFDSNPSFAKQFRIEFGQSPTQFLALRQIRPLAS